MNRIPCRWSSLLFVAGILLIGSLASGDPEWKVQSVEEVRVHPFDLAQVRLLPGPFQHAMQKDVDYLLRLEPDRLLSRFREYAGLQPKAPIYGGWETQTISGHSLGHYLSACALGWAATGDQRLRERVNYIVAELAKCQKAHGNGYVGAIPNGRKVLEQEVAAGKIRSKGFDLNGIWVPWYTTHKVMAGLRDAWLHCDSTQARTVLVGLADWSCGVTDKLSDEQLQQMLHCEHGGMNEVAADVYAMTGDKKYLELARRFYHKAVLDPLAERKDCLPGLHGNTQIPKIIGIARQYELTGSDRMKTIAEFFWDRVVNHHSYVIGGHSNGEYFGEPDQLSDRLSDNTTETCNTYNMLKLTTRVFGWNPKAEYMDFYERALINHILASQHPDTGMMCYYVPLRQGARKTYSTPYDSFWCCTGTGMENHVRYGEAIYAHGEDSLYVNLFIASELDWPEKGLALRQESSYPTGDSTTLTMKCSRPVELTLLVRHPSWAAQGVQVRLNGETESVASTPGRYFKLNREWKDGDTVEITFPMELRTEAMPDNADRIAMLYGPMVLAGQFGARRPEPWIPVLLADPAKPQSWLHAVQPQPLVFETREAGQPMDFTLIPFHRMHDQYYSVYFDIFDEQQWAKRQADYEAEQRRLRELEARTTDLMRIGEMQPERDHNLEGERTRTGEHNGRKWRDAWDGGWFAFDMTVDPEKPVELVCTYWGSDGGDRRFDILVDGSKIATESLRNQHPGEFFDVTYPVPTELTKGKDTVRIRLQGHPGNMAGGLFGCRIIRTIQP